MYSPQEQGLVESGEVKMVERFQTGYGLVQCFRYCAYRHIAKHSRVDARCGHCSGPHETRECTKNKVKAVFANCSGGGLGSKEHKAWSESCPVRKKTSEALAVRFSNRLQTYPQAIRPDHRAVASLVVEKELEKRGLADLRGQETARSPAGTLWKSTLSLAGH